MKNEKKGKSHLLPLSVCDHLIRGFQIITKYKTVDKEVYKSRGYMSMVISLLFIISIGYKTRDQLTIKWKTKYTTLSEHFQNLI
jgi:hypothetical protein